jgi:hypothetical protein
VVAFRGLRCAGEPDPAHLAGIKEAIMTDVLAIIHPGPDEATVPAVAQEVAKILHAQLRELWTTPEPSDLSARSADRALHDPDVALVVVGRDPGNTSSWTRVARAANMPVVVVPPSLDYSPGAICRVLVPLDGTSIAGQAVAGALAAFAYAGAELVVLVVATATTGPRCIDHVPWGYLAWQEQFLDTFCAHPHTRIVLCAGGDPGPQITRTATTEQVDLITLSWSRPSRPDRAAIVRHTVRTATVPVLLIPTDQHRDPFLLSAKEPAWRLTAASRTASPGPDGSIGAVTFRAAPTAVPDQDSDRGPLNEWQGCLTNSPAEPEDRPESHNVSVDEQLAREGGCAQVHLASGRTCSLEHGHSGSCNFVLRERV